MLGFTMAAAAMMARIMADGSVTVSPLHFSIACVRLAEARGAEMVGVVDVRAYFNRVRPFSALVSGLPMFCSPDLADAKGGVIARSDADTLDFFAARCPSSPEMVSAFRAVVNAA